MPMLETAQRAMAWALDRGPAELPDGLFGGTSNRVLLGMKVHANTISHARLVALEDTFPRTRALMGHDRFNERSRRFAGLPGATMQPLAGIGQGFPSFLAEDGEPAPVVGLARFEWLWLEAYHAAEALPLRLATLAGMAENALLEVEIAAHPAARCCCPDRAVFELLGEQVPGLGNADVILIARPDAEVLVSPATASMARILGSVIGTCGNRTTIGNLFTDLTEPASLERGCKDRLPPDDFMPALVALLEAGVLQDMASVPHRSNNGWER